MTPLCCVEVFVLAQVGPVIISFLFIDTSQKVIYHNWY